METINHLLPKALADWPIHELFSFDIMPWLSLVRFQPGELIIRRGEHPEQLYELIRGKAKITMSEANGRDFINIAEAPSFIGEIELLGAQDLADEVRAYSECYCYRIDSRRCSDRMLKDPLFLRKMCIFLCRDSLTNMKNYTHNQAYPLQNRLAKFLLQMAQDGVYREKHTEAAKYLGVSYRHLLMVIADFTEKGLLEKLPRGYRLADVPALERLAEEIR